MGGPLSRGALKIHMRYARLLESGRVGGRARTLAFVPPNLDASLTVSQSSAKRVDSRVTAVHVRASEPPLAVRTLRPPCGVATRAPPIYIYIYIYI